MYFNLLPLDVFLALHKVNPALNSLVLVYAPGFSLRSTVGVKGLTQEHNTALEPRLLDLELSEVTTRPLSLPYSV